MITLPEYKGRKIAVVGLGKSGNAVAAALLASGAEVVAWDDNEASRHTLAEQVTGDIAFLPPDAMEWDSLDMLVLSPGIPLTHPTPHKAVTLAKKANCPIIGDIELLYLANPDATYVGITGTNGKSTTTALIGHILEQAGRDVRVGGNLGNPVMAFDPVEEGGVYVLELSSYQLDLLDKMRINVAVLLNITPDHLDRHGDMDGYIHAKKRIFARQQAGDTAITGVDNAVTTEIYEHLKVQSAAETIAISNSRVLEEGLYVQDNTIIAGGEAERLAFGPLKHLPGQHNWQNIVAAYAATRALGINQGQFLSALKTFPGLAHRLQYVGDVDGVAFVNDSKATNAEAASHALEAYEHIFWIAGGMAKEGGIESLSPLFNRVDKVFLIGQAQEAFANMLENKLDYVRCETLENAVTQAFTAAKEAGVAAPVVLLSPACASFDQFKNFEERGERFCALVKGLG